MKFEEIIHIEGVRFKARYRGDWWEYKDGLFFTLNGIKTDIPTSLIFEATWTKVEPETKKCPYCAEECNWHFYGVECANGYCAYSSINITYTSLTKQEIIERHNKLSDAIWGGE